jgi:hypothetical protein
MTENTPCPAEEGSLARLDVERLKGEIRKAAARRRAAGTAFSGVAALGVEWDLLAAGLRRLEGQADITAGRLDLPRFRGPLRAAARLLARAILYLSRFLTTRQREYNHAVLTSLHNVHRGLRRLEDEHKEEILRLREELQHFIERKLGDEKRRAA